MIWLESFHCGCAGLCTVSAYTRQEGDFEDDYEEGDEDDTPGGPDGGPGGPGEPDAAVPPMIDLTTEMDVKEELMEAAEPEPLGETEASKPLVERGETKASEPSVERDETKASEPSVERDETKPSEPLPDDAAVLPQPRLPGC